MAKTALALFLMFAFTTFAQAAERFSEQHYCDPALNNVQIHKCMTVFFNDVEAKRMVLERKRFFTEEELLQPGATQAQDLFYNSIDLFNAYRQVECLGQRYGAGAISTAGLGELDCKIRLTEQRIDFLMGN